ncbi:MAG: phosphatidate cytidylyltransferase [Candidatus Riflebacteria bacterium]|nr:phosphatidate cytidylyltransferase [Candidatus Riflebacteria bacterium]
MISRIIIALIGIPAVYFFLTAGDYFRFTLLLIVSLIGQFELYRMFSTDQKSSPYPEFFLGTIIMLASALWLEKGLAVSAGISVMALGSMIVLKGFNENGYKRFSLGMVNILYIPFCLSFFLILGHIKGGEVLFAVLAAVWALDTGAYAVGMTFRGPALAPKISPKKTISGSVGGLFAVILTVFLLSKTRFLPLGINKAISLGISIGIFGQLSDLFESVLKREAGIKDSGTILGAHGGILDRIDSLIFVAPIAYLYLAL